MANKLWDIECTNCSYIWEAWTDECSIACCPKCDSAFTRVIPGGLKTIKAKEPYEYLDRRPPDPKKIYSSSRSRSK